MLYRLTVTHVMYVLLHSSPSKSMCNKVKRRGVSRWRDWKFVGFASRILVFSAARNIALPISCDDDTNLQNGPRPCQERQPAHKVKIHRLWKLVAGERPLTTAIDNSALPLPKSGGGEDWPRQGKAAADESLLTHGQPPLVSSCRVSASTTRRVGTWPNVTKIQCGKVVNAYGADETVDALQRGGKRRHVGVCGSSPGPRKREALCGCDELGGCLHTWRKSSL
jgi:hypothetical protein